MEPTVRQLRLPWIRRATLRGFSLYSLQPTVTVDFPEGAFCLVGANGIGKSTFLQAINYALTGIVPEPNRKFESVEEYYKDTMDFSKSFFAGRISERDRTDAEVELEFLVGNRIYTLTRAVFDPRELRTFEVRFADDPTRVLLDSTEQTAAQRNATYMHAITADVGVERFTQLAFLQAFVLTFDERRHLLFWDARVLEQALYLAFGVDHGDARRADELKRDIEKADSRVRNMSWQASAARKTMEDIRASSETDPTDATTADEIWQEYERLFDEQTVTQTALEQLGLSRQDALLMASEQASRHTTLRLEYMATFEQRVNRRSRFADHPLIVTSEQAGKCGICGAEGENVHRHLTQVRQAESCPLCGTQAVTPEGDQGILERLRNLDQKLVALKHEMEDSAATVKRLDTEIEQATHRHTECTQSLANFEREHASLLQQQRDAGAAARTLEAILRPYQIQLEEALEKKARAYAQREEKKRELQPLQRRLAASYLQAETEFVPVFRDLAYHFLGLDLDIRLESSAAKGVTLVLNVRNSSRREQHQLSESQRFFLDIALRMALCQYMAAADSKAGMFIDTPEGSLDVAYEKRAGGMIARFVNSGYHILMTANLNGSRLLRAMAAECGPEKMTLCRMTSWSELSDVQINEEAAFNEVFHDIEGALQSRRL